MVNKKLILNIFKPSYTLLAVALVALGGLLVFLPSQYAVAQSADCRPGYERPAGADEHTGCIKANGSSGPGSGGSFTASASSGSGDSEAPCKETEVLNEDCSCKGGGNYNDDCSPKSDCQVLTRDGCGIIDYLWKFINFLTAIVAIVVVISITIGGIQYSASKGDPGAVSAAKGRIRDAVFALLVYIFAYAFLQWVVPGGIF